MGVKYVKEFMYPSDGGFHKGAQPMKARASYKDMPVRAMPNAPARGAARMESPPKVGKGQGFAMGGAVPGYDMDRLPAKKPPGRGMDLAPSKPERGEYQGYAKGGKAKGEKKVAKVMREYKEGKLHSGSKKGPMVKDRKQAIAIALSEARKAGAKIPKKAEGGEIDNYAGKTGPYRGSPKKARELGKKDRMEGLKKAIIADDLAKARRLGKTYNEMYSDEFKKAVKEGALTSEAIKAKKAYELHSPKEVRKIYESDKEYFEKNASRKAEGGIFSTESMAYQSKGPKTRYTPAKGRRMARERAMERRALDKARHAEKYAPGLSLDMPDRKKDGGMPVHRRKPMYGKG